MTATRNGTGSVLAVLVVHDGSSWLTRTLDALAAQTYGDIQVLAVDNASTDGSRDLLLDRLGEERVLLADRDLGFAAAVSMALDAAPSPDAPFVLLLHDDLALAPDAVEHLVTALDSDPRLAAVGPKLRSWGGAGELQSVGWTIDITGRADSGVDVGELDQGQRDQERRSLYVSTGGMLVRRLAFDEVGRFDRRYHLFRDDLDLCWRLWLAGHDVEVQPEAVGEHRAAAANYVRLGQTRFIGPRYFAERNTLATLLKNYGALRLLLVVPLFVLVGFAKIAGFMLTRRFSDAWQTLRAWLWNVLHLRETRRLRRRVQASRRRTDAELAPLFGRIGPRVRAYVEAMASWVSGGDVDPAPEPSHAPAPPVRRAQRLAALLSRRPSLLAASVLTTVFALGAWQLFLPGELRGGSFRPWPASPLAFLADYGAGWHDAAAFGTAAAPSPAQGLLGLWQLLFGGSAYLASRALLFAPYVVAFVLALRAAQHFSPRRGPRVVAAAAYVLSPPALAALVVGDLGALVTLAVLPGIAATGLTLARRRVLPSRAWRSVAAFVLLTAVAGAFEPLFALTIGIVALTVGVLLAVTASEHAWRLAILSRFSAAGLGPLVLLLPWSLELLDRRDLVLGASNVSAVGGEAWRWLLLAPPLPGFPGMLAGAGFVAAGLLGLVLGARRRAAAVVAMWAVVLVGAVAGWWIDRSLDGVWAGLPLLAVAAAYAGLLAVAFATGEAQLARHAFGWRQLATLATGLLVAASLVVMAVSVVAADLTRYRVGQSSLPSFVAAEAADGPPFRVLVLATGPLGVAWDVVGGGGPTMAAYGVPANAEAMGLVEQAVVDLLDRRDPGVADRLAMLGVRYVHVPPDGVSPELDRVLAAQLHLEPRPLADGRLLEVTGAMPAVAWVPADAARALDAGRSLPDDAEPRPFSDGGDGRAEGWIPEEGDVLVAEVDDGGWRLTVAGRLHVTDGEGQLARFRGIEPGRAVLSHQGSTTRGLAVAGQLLAVLLAVSLALRPPDFARRLAVADPVRPVEPAREPLP